jgi:hypothetical protein
MSGKLTVEELRAKFKAKSQGKREFTGSSDVYPHWNLDIEGSSIVRILPDKNEDNENFYFVERLEHKLSIEGTDRKISCMKMYGEKCPICELSSKYYKAEGKDSVQGKYYYFKRTNLLKALIIKDGIDYEAANNSGESVAGQVKTLQFTYQLKQVIDNAIGSNEEELALQAVPWDMDEGYNFIIKKGKQGQYDSYHSSSFSNKVSAISESLREVAEEGIVDLKTLLPANPGIDKVQALLEQHLGTYEGDEEEEEEEEEAPTPRPRRVVDEEEAAPAIPKRTRPVVEAEEEEEEAAPAPKRKRVVEAVEEEEAAPAPKRKRVVEAEEEEEEEEEEESEENILDRIRNRKRASAE